MFRSLAFLAPLLALPSVSSLPTDDCPILGPIFPKSFDVSQSEAFINATELFPEVIAGLFETGAVNETGSAFYIDVFSTQTNTSIYSYGHVGSGVQTSQQGGEMSDETIFRIGSVSKLYTAYAVLVAGGLDIWRDPVTKYIPELEGNPRDQPNDFIIWEDISIGALLSQQAGTAGFPTEGTVCFTEGTCTRELYFDWMKNMKRPVHLPWDRAVYSDNHFALLGRVLERITNQTYEESLISVLGEPLGLDATSTTLPPNGSNVFALQSALGLAGSSWGFDAFLSEGSGGVYSSGADMRKIGLSILHSELLSVTDTHEWMNPHGHTSSLTTSLGAPWEIFRLGLPVSPGSNRTRISDLYTKAGGQAGYGTILALSPDHGIGFSLNVAGDTASSERWILRSAVGESFIIAAEWAAAANAAENYTGIFVHPDDETTNITLSAEPDKPGLGMDGYFIEGLDVLTNISAPFGLAAAIPSSNLSVRLYPNGIADAEGNVGFYGIPGVIPRGPRSALEGGTGLFDLGCESWQNLGFYSYTGAYPEGFVINVADGRAVSISHPISNVTLERRSASGGGTAGS